MSYSYVLSSFPFSPAVFSPNKNGIPFIKFFVCFASLDSGTMHPSHIDVLKSRVANGPGPGQNMVCLVLKLFIKPCFKVGTVSDSKPTKGF